MSQTRRDFLKHSGILSAGLITFKPFGGGSRVWAADSDAVNALATTPAYTGAYPIHQGLTFEDFAYFSVLRPKTAELSFEVVDSKNAKQTLLAVQAVGMKGSDLQLDRFKSTGLQLGQTYKFRVLDAKGKIVDERNFKTLDTNKKNPKVAIASCMNDFFKSACTQMWASLGNQSPDMVFLVGDTCYADNDNDGTQLGYWKRYTETRTKIGFFRHKNLVPVMAVWDDHDFGGNNFDGSYAEKQFTLELFTNFWLYPEQDKYKRGVGVSQVLSIFGYKFCLMDDRFYRNESTQWGDTQKDQLFATLSSDNSPAFLMNGSQFFGGYLKKDAYEYKQTKDLSLICQQLSRINAPVCFVSGDVHFSEVMQIESKVLGYKTFEITSSSMHSFTFLGNHLRKKNPRRLAATSKHNFTILQLDNTTSKFKFTSTAFDEDGDKKINKTLEIVR